MVRGELFAGFRSGGGDRIGLELELFPVVRLDDSCTILPAPLERRSGWSGPTLADLFDHFATRPGWRLYDDGSGGTAIELPEGGRITLEPAGQIEYSTAPHRNAREAVDDLRAMALLLDDAGRKIGIEFLDLGYNNICEDEALHLQVKKARYLAMDQHFEAIGPFGRKMMRATCSLQINLDFGPSSIVAERWRLANMIAPSLNAIFANSPHEYQGRPFRSFRGEIWRHADPTRTGRLYDQPDLDPVADYLRFALDATVMMIQDESLGAIPPEAPMTFGEWLAGSGHHGFPDWDDWRLHLTTLFPDVRARGWMELRSIDALPPEWLGVPVALASTLLYNDTLRREALARLERRDRRRDPADYEHDGFWQSDYETGAELLALAISGITDRELALEAERYHSQFCSLGMTPADARTRASLH
jgi:glutamate--cysteine ligase